MGRTNANGLPAGLRKGPSGYFLDLRVHREGRLHRVKQHLGQIPKRAAVAILTKRKTEILEGTYLRRRDVPRITFEELMHDFLEWGKGRKRSWDRDVKTSRLLLTLFGSYVAAEIPPALIEETVQRWRTEPCKTKKPARAATINRRLALTKAVFNHAIRNGKLEKSPALSIKLLREHNVRDRVLSADEFRRLLDASSMHLRPILQTAFWTAMRYSEIVQLTWDRVDLRESFIKLRPEDTKTDEGREVPIAPQLREVFLSLPRSIVTNRVFLWEGRGLQSVRTAFRSACRRAGISNFTFHDFRHTAITNMHRSGAQYFTVMAITGHKTLHMFKRYTSVNRMEKLATVQRIGDFLETSHIDAKAESS